MDLTNTLWHSYLNDPAGLCGHSDPAWVLKQILDQESRLSVLAFSSLNFSPEYLKLLEKHQSWLFQPQITAYKRSQEVQQEINRLGLRVPKHIPRAWWQVSRGVQGRFQGSWTAFFHAQANDALAIQSYLQKSKATFPVLSGNVTSACWLDIVHRIGEIQLTNWQKLAVPLGAKEKISMRAWGSRAEKSHPSLRLALKHWQKSCQSSPSCGLADCPNRSG